MMSDHQVMRVPDENKIHPLELEVNWNPRDTKSNGCKLIRVLYPDGRQAILRKEHLMAAMFAFGNEVEQRQLIPQTTTRSKWYKTMLGITAHKDIRKGEKINVNVNIPIPTVEEEVAAEIKRELLKKPALLRKLLKDK